MRVEDRVDGRHTLGGRGARAVRRSCAGRPACVLGALTLVLALLLAVGTGEDARITASTVLLLVAVVALSLRDRSVSMRRVRPRVHIG